MIYLVRIWPGPLLKNSVIEQQLNQEQDWIRFDEMTWLVQSMRSADAIARRLHSLVGPHGMYLVIQVQTRNAQGGMTKEFWDWINARAP